MFKKLQFWILFAFIITSLCGLMYLADQQILRMGANDPQIQMSEDIAQNLSARADSNPFLASQAVDIAKSLSPFIIVYKNNKIDAIASNATLDGKIPQLPEGVLAATKEKGQSRFTWQPKPGVRIATVITPYSNKQSSGFVLVGRSLREVEIREDNLLTQVGLAWFAIMVGSLIAVSLFTKRD